VARWLLWTCYVMAWTIALLYPSHPETGLREIDDWLEPIHYAVAKSVHVSAYMVLTLLTGWVRAPMRYRWLLMFFVMAHGTATEMGQLITNEMGWSSRLGDLRDVAFDNFGILLGLLIGWKWWMADDAGSTSTIAKD
jgi:hypothetical protein